MKKTQLLFTKVWRYLLYYPQDILKIIKLILIYNFYNIINNFKLSNEDYLYYLYKIFIEADATQEEINFYLEEIVQKNLT